MRQVLARYKLSHSTMHAAPSNMLLILAVALATTGCLSPHGGFRLPFAHEPKPQIYGGDGRSHDTALQVSRVPKNDRESIEVTWVQGYRFSDSERPTRESFRRSITRKSEKVGGKVYDVLTFVNSDGKPENVYFDVTKIVHD
jgi:hypothetical protein